MLMETSAYLIAPGGLHTCHSCQPEKRLHFTFLSLFLFQVSFLANIASLSLRCTVLNPLVAVIGYAYPRTHPSFFPSFPSHLPHCVPMGGSQVHLIIIYIFNANYQEHCFKMLLL